jgi:hypothetical protein
VIRSKRTVQVKIIPTTTESCELQLAVIVDSTCAVRVIVVILVIAVSVIVAEVVVVEMLVWVAAITDMVVVVEVWLIEVRADVVIVT